MYSAYNNLVTFSELRVGQLFHVNDGNVYRKVDDLNALAINSEDISIAQVVQKEVYHIPQH
jgi:hypothetical protein